MKKMLKKLKFKNKYLIILGSILLVIGVGLGIFAFQKSYASVPADLQIQYGTFENLPANYAQIAPDFGNQQIVLTNNYGGAADQILTFNDGRAPGTMYISDMGLSAISTDQTYVTTIGYYGPVNFGAKNAVGTANASLNYTYIRNNWKVTVKNGVVLSDGTRADFNIEVPSWILYLGKFRNIAQEEYNYSTLNMYVPIIDVYTWGLLLCTRPPIDPAGSSSLTTTTANDFQGKISITRNGVNILGTSEFPQMLFGVGDLDVGDRTRGDNIRGEPGIFDERVVIYDGIKSPLVVTNPSYLNININQNNWLFTRSTNIPADCADLNVGSCSIPITENIKDIRSGFMVPMSGSELLFNWYSSARNTINGVSTALFNIPSVTVHASSGVGGQIEKPGLVNYTFNYSTTYDYTPAPGYKVKSLKVKNWGGTETSISLTDDQKNNGGTYRFDKLYRNPLTDSSSSGDYTIHVEFEHIPYEVTYKSDSNGTVVGTGNETKTYDENPSGRTTTPKERYALKGWTCDKDVTLTDGTTITAGTMLTSAQVKTVKVRENLTFKAIHEKNKVEITYKTDGHGTVDKTNEVLNINENPVGITNTPNQGYKYLLTKCDKNVTLNNGTTIINNREITLTQIRQIKLTEDLTCTVYHRPDITTTYKCE